MARVALLVCLALLIYIVVASISVSSEGIEGSNLSASSKSQYGSRLPYGAREGSLRQSECPSACSYRCSKTSKRKACMSFCMKCCSKCLCVPPGTYGNKEVCPCYNDWKTQQGGPKCP